MEVPVEYEPSPPSRDNECPVVSVCGVTRQVGIVYIHKCPVMDGCMNVKLHVVLYLQLQ